MLLLLIKTGHLKVAVTQVHTTVHGSAQEIMATMAINKKIISVSRITAMTDS